MPNVFLSHSRADKPLARRIAVDLSMSGIKVWFDEWKIKVGHSITQCIERGLDDADFVIVLLTSHSVSSGWVQKEWRSRIGDEASSHGIYILPVLAEDCEIPRLLKDKKYADIRNNYNSGLRDLITAIREHAAVGPVAAGARIESGRIVYERMVPDFPLYRGLINTIESGCFERCDTGLRVHVQIVSSHQAMEELAEEMGFNRLTLESGDYSISTDPGSPSEFSSTLTFQLPAGQDIPNVITGQRIRLPFALSGTVRTQVSGIATGGIIEGRFSQITKFDQLIPMRRVDITGSFRAVVAL
jgi:TIR domain